MFHFHVDHVGDSERTHASLKDLCGMYIYHMCIYIYIHMYAILFYLSPVTIKKNVVHPHFMERALLYSVLETFLCIL